MLGSVYQHNPDKYNVAYILPGFCLFKMMVQDGDNGLLNGEEQLRVFQEFFEN